MNFYLGVHEPAWLARSSVPLFVSHRRLARRVKLPVATHRWALDSGGFSELSMYGRWKTTPAEYAEAAQAYASDVGDLDWAAPQDWMCEPQIIHRTRRSVAWHQAATIESVIELRRAAPDVPWVPVVQGWQIDDYLAHIDRYSDAGIDLTDEPVVGVGSVCRRQATGEIEEIFVHLAGAGLRCHGFGVKTLGLTRYAKHLTSADSMAWSFEARRADPLPGCVHPRCQNCWRYALTWRQRLLDRIPEAS